MAGQPQDGVSGDGVIGTGRGAGNAGVYGQNSSDGGYGVRALSFGIDGVGVAGVCRKGTGVQGEGINGLVGIGYRDGFSGVYGRHDGSTVGPGVTGDGKGTSGAGVLGRNSAGYGGQFEGGRAQLRLVPAATAGRPTTGNHARGELYINSKANLFVCTVGGTPGTWKRFSTV